MTKERSHERPDHPGHRFRARPARPRGAVLMLGYAIRIGITALIAGLASLKASIGDGLDSAEIVDVISATLVAGAAYAGIGAASKTVEPDVGVRE